MVQKNNDEEQETKNDTGTGADINSSQSDTKAVAYGRFKDELGMFTSVQIEKEEKIHRLSESMKKISVHDHIAMLYSEDEERFDVLSQYIRIGLERGERCVYVAEEEEEEEEERKMIAHLRLSDVDMSSAIKKGSLVILRPKDTYLLSGEFSAEGMFKFLTQAVQLAKEEGYTALRFLVDMSWSCKRCESTAFVELTEYEGKLNKFANDYDCILMSQYNRNRFSPSVLLNVIHEHQTLLVNGVLCKNTCYLPFRRNSLGVDEYEKEDIDNELILLSQRESDLRELYESKEKFYAIFNESPDLIIITRPPDGMILDMNKDHSAVLGYQRAECVGKTIIEVPIWTSQRDYYTYISSLEKTGQLLDYEVNLHRKNGETVVVLISGKIISINGTRCVLSIIHNITELKASEKALARRNIMSCMLSEVNGVLVHASDEMQLLSRVCKAIVDIGHFSMAWVGYAEDDINKSVLPVAHAGTDESYINELNLTWAEGDSGTSPAGVAIRTGTIVIVTDFSEDPTIAFRSESAERHGFKSTIALPLIMRGKVFGMLGVYSGQIDAFTLGDNATFQELASDLSFGIQSIRTYEEERKTAEKLESAYAKERALLNSLGEAVVAIDIYGQIIMANNAMERLLRVVGKKKIVGLGTEGVLPLKNNLGVNVPSSERPFARVLSSNKQFGPAEFILILNDGVEIPILLTSSPVLMEGKVIGVIDVIHDLTKTKEVERLRTDFLSLASHQLRTPLSGTKWIIETLRSNKLGPLLPAQDKYLEEIYSINEHMIRLVMDMLSAIRVTDESIEFQRETISVPEVLTKTLTILGGAAKAKNITIINRSKEHAIPEIKSDPVLICTILETLISNAIDYSNEGQEVTFDVVSEKDSVAFIVHDNGIGIPKDEQSRAFERFFRASNARRARPSGTGLGLNIANTLAIRVGGSITFVSNEKDGTTFMLHIPNV